MLLQKVKAMMCFPILHSSKDSTTYKTQYEFVECKLNVRMLLASFFIDTGGYDVAKALVMVGLGNALSFERNFSNRSLKLAYSIRKVCDLMIHEAFVDEVLLTYKEISCSKID